MSSINRPATEVIKALSEIGCDTICSTLDALGIRRNSIVGPIAREYEEWLKTQEQ